MIKRIPIKGISRDPSGQVAADGFCAESLNVQLDMGEVAPVIKPQPVKDASGEEIQVEGDILFIHKGIGYENLIYRVGNALSFLVTVGEALPGIVYGGLADGEVINDITAIGNTLIVSTSVDMYYILWKEGSYRFLGNSIPVPDIHFRIGNLSARRKDASIPAGATMDDFDIIDTFDWHVEFEDGAFVNAPDFKHDSPGDTTEFGTEGSKYILDSALYEGFWTEYLNFVWSLIDRQVRSQSEAGKAVYPIFIRYAVRLYDGTLYAQSIPVLMGADISRFFASRCTLDISGLRTFTNIAIHIDNLMMFAKGYSVFMDAGDVSGLYEGWEDIVTGVDVFVSPQILPVQRNAAHIITRFEGENQSNRWFNLEQEIDPYYAVLHQDQMIRYYQATYLASSFTLAEFVSAERDKKLDINFSSDYIMAQEALKETPWSMHHTVGEHLFTYNKRLLLTGAEQSLYHGYPFLNSVEWADELTPVGYRFDYHLRVEGADATVVCRGVDGNALVVPQKAAVVEGDPTIYSEWPVAWLAYPDSRCYKVDVYCERQGGSVFMASYKMKPMDQVDVAYAFFGFGARISPETRVSTRPLSENDKIKMPSTLLVSKANNPFVFPVEDTVTFTAGEILNLAVATKALSEGQFGQFPLYVFTDEGVFAMSVDSQGALQDSHPVSRDVLISRDALAGIEQGVFFAAARGLLLLQGSAVTKVSELMDGPATALDDETSALISGRYDVPVDAPSQFYKFLSGCKLTYDYANTRIILFREDDETQYVYKFDTQSWHRMNAGTGQFVRALNSFPEALVVTKGNGPQSVRNLSVLAESDGAEAVPGLIYTRDLILDNADVYKTVSRLKVRGRFLDGHVKWLLQGSNDGINYRNLHSLRGPSWKWYRIAIVSMLDPGERISYVELDYSPRFIDKIR